MRIIARLDVKQEHLIKSIQYDGVRKLGNPNDFARRYYVQGIDEIIYTDVVASLYGRNNLSKVVEQASDEIFVPLTVGGGVCSVNDARSLFDSGADKISVNTAAIRNPNLISDLAVEFGSQATVVSIEAKKSNDGESSWEALIEHGREHSYIEAITWAQKACDMGAGEILVTSIDRDGTGLGLDLELIKRIRDVVNVPLICSGGVGTADDVVSAAKLGVNAVAIGKAFHYRDIGVRSVKETCCISGIEVRYDT